MEFGADTILGTRMQFSVSKTMGYLGLDLVGGLFLIFSLFLKNEALFCLF
ncbi:hypothetical protein HS096_01975 [candidate division WWE3 bacterium]|jgi:hypothetical protein|uniref:Uncharacterized protein n=1 Tax=candidate division WWE3 bacterium TaxID=2053526 RepID=A0A928TVG2_UNCKA|nr:hypothetical protein [candidate division WWE3 bacterium]